VHLRRVGHDRPKIVREIVLDADVLGVGFPGDGQRLPEDVLDLDKLRHARGSVRKRENLAHQLDPALGALFERGDDSQVLGIGRVLAERGRGEHDGGENVVEIVSDSGSQHPDALEALGAEVFLVETVLLAGLRALD